MKKTILPFVTLGFAAASLVTAAPYTWEKDIDETISDVIEGTEGLVKSGSGTLTLTAVNTFTGSIRISEGTLAFTQTAALGGFSKEIILDSGTLRSNGPWASLGGAGGNVRIRLGQGGGTLDSSGSGGLAFNNTGNLSFEGSGSRTLTLSGTNTSTSNNIGLNIINQSVTGITSLEKTGTGTWSINGASTYTGTTAIKEGILRLASAATLQNATGDILVQGGTLANSVSTTVGGNIILSSGHLDSEGIASITLAAGKNFTMNGGTWTADFAADGAFDQIIGTGTGSFDITGGTLSLNIADAGNFNYSLTYQLLSGFGSGNVSGLTVTGYDTANYLAVLADNGFLHFNAIPEPTTVALLFGGMTLLFVSLKWTRWK